MREIRERGRPTNGRLATVGRCLAWNPQSFPRRLAAAAGERGSSHVRGAGGNHVGVATADGPPDYRFTKARWARGWSYPLKRSDLDRALAKAEASVASVNYKLDMAPLDQRTYGTLIAIYY